MVSICWLEGTTISTISERVRNHGRVMLVIGMVMAWTQTRESGQWAPFHRASSISSQADTSLRLIKSGTDFRDLSSASLELTDTPPKSVRRKLVSSLTGKHHYILPSSPSSKPVEELLKSLLHSVEGTLGKPVCFTLSAFDARSELVRTQETGLGNWIADVLMHAYAESLIEGGGSDMFEKKSASEQNKKGEAAVGDHDHNNGNDPDGVKTPKKRVTKDVDVLRRAKGGADAVIICGGTLRGDSQYGPGQITLGDILGESSP